MNALEKEYNKLLKAEQKFRNKEMKSFPYKERLMKKVPQKLQNTLDTAFIKAFETAFLKGTALLEKTYDKEEILLEHEAMLLMAQKKPNRKHIRNMDKTSKKSGLLHDALSTTSGTVMGFLGMGLPDIPVLVSMMLRQIYQCALSYGYEYDTDIERIFILQLIRESLSETVIHTGVLEEEIIKTAKCLSEKLLVEKFIQGIPVVGTAGGFINHQIMRRINQYARISYKKRWLETQIQKVH